MITQKKMSLSLWHLMVKAHESDHSHDHLTCDECAAMVELIIEAESLGARLAWLQEITGQHLATCPTCRQELGERLAREIMLL